MISSDLTISLANWVLNIEKQRAALAADNIYRSSTGGVKRTGDFDALISRMSSAVSNGEATEIDRISQVQATIQTSSNGDTGPIALDEEILTLSQAKGRFKVISEALARKYGLMNLAAGGK